MACIRSRCIPRAGGGAAGETSQVKGKNVILATGSEARTIFGLEPDSRILTNVEILAINQVPKSADRDWGGGGRRGVQLDFPQLRLGSDDRRVLPRAVPVEDEEISKELTRVFKKRGIDMNTGSKVEKIEKTEAGVKVTWTDSNGKDAGEGSREGAGGRGPGGRAPTISISTASRPRWSADLSR